MPPSATAPVYKEKVYVKALRMPKNIGLKFKNDDYFSKKKNENKPKNVDMFSSSEDSNVNQANDVGKFNSSNGTKAAESSKQKTNSFEDKANDLHNLINGNKKTENENKKVNKEDQDVNDLGFTFHASNL